MSMLIQIAMLVVIVVICVHVVFKHGVTIGMKWGQLEGKEEGIKIGRDQILNENIIRMKLIEDDTLDGVKSFIESQTYSTQHSRQACKYIADKTS